MGYPGLVTVMLLVVMFAGAGCATVTVTDTQMLELVVVESKASPVETNISGDIYDPWKPFNSKIHAFNTDYFDQYLMKPVAGSYSEVVEEGERRLIRNVLDNLSSPKRLINSLLQGKFGGAGRELSRMIINSTLGGVGMADVAKYQFGIEKSDEDFGQTLEAWGWTTSRYLLVPFMPPMTVRDGVGFVVDQITSPVTYFFPIPFIGALAKDTVAYINNRGLQLEIDQHLEEPRYEDLRNSFFVKREELKVQ
jgi:phospholipid-binding lipoprotein MlaA